ncbi:hypothetical protein DICVIV_14086, partial [Dictyocaulus viviparus]
MGQELEIIDLKAKQKTMCVGVEMFKKLLDKRCAGFNVGILWRAKKESYQPQFYVRTTETRSIKLLKRKEMVMPGDN